MQALGIHSALGIGELSARDTIAPGPDKLTSTYANALGAALAAKMQGFACDTIQQAADLSQEIGIARLIVNNRLEKYAAIDALPDSDVNKQASLLHQSVLVHDAIDKVQRLCDCSSRIHRNFNQGEQRSDMFLMGALAQTLSSFAQQGVINQQQAVAIESQMYQQTAPQGNYGSARGDGPVISTIPSHITTDSIVTAMDETIPVVDMKRAAG